MEVVWRSVWSDKLSRAEARFPQGRSPRARCSGRASTTTPGGGVFILPPFKHDRSWLHACMLAAMLAQMHWGRGQGLKILFG